MSSRSEQPPEDHVTAGSDMVGCDDFMRRFVGQLICDTNDSSELRVISLLGERATGKTAMVRSVYDRQDIRHHFKSRAWVRILVGSGLEDILFDVLRQTTTCTLEDVDCLREPELSEMLKKALIKQRCLVVLDNLQCVDLMEKLLVSFAHCRNGSRVIITTRNMSISLRLGPRHSCHLELKGYPPVIRQLGKRPSPSAEGFPNNCTLREIVSLSYNSLPDWLKPWLLYFALFPRESEIPVRRLFNIWLADGLSTGCPAALNELVNRKMVHVVRQKLDRSTKTCLMPGFIHDFLSEMVMDVRNSEISDHSMSTSSRKPRVQAIAVKILMSASGEQGMTVQANTFEEPRQTRATNMSCLSLNSAKHPSCLPSELRYIAIKMDVDNKKFKQMHMSNGAKTQYVPKFFRSFMLFTSCKQGEHPKDIEMFLKPLCHSRRFPFLKVLDLEHVYKPPLPKRLGKIAPNLRYLGLRWTALVSLPRSVQFMSHLDTLDLKHTNVASVPSSILKKGSLQHLYMNGVCLDWSFCCKASYQKSLANLKTLWGLYIGGKGAMLDVLSKLTGLRKLALTSHDMVAYNVAESVARLTNLESLRWSSVDTFDHSSTLELSGMSNHQSLLNLHLIGKLDGLSGLPKKLNILTLSMTQLVEDPMTVLGKLKNLISLKLFADSFKGRRMTCTEGTFPELRVLKLWKLKLLRKWTIEASALPCLQELEIRNCKKLTHIVGLKHVKCLKEITLTEVKGEVATTAEQECPGAVVIERGLAVSPPQEGHDINKEEDNEESHGVEAEGGDDNDLEETDSGDNSGTDEGADEQEDNEEDGEVGHGNDNEQGDSNGDTRTDEGADEEQENEEEAATGNEGGDEDKDKDENDCKEGEEDKDKDENADEVGDDDGGNEGGGGGDGNEEEGNDGDDSDCQDAFTNIGRNDEAKDEDEDNYEETEENGEKGEENDNEEEDSNNDEEKQNADEAADENENDRDEKGDDDNSGKEEEKDKQSEAEARDGDDSDHERGDLNDDDDEGETKSCKMNMKLELNMETEANVKNELTLTVVWKKTKDDKKRKS